MDVRTRNAALGLCAFLSISACSLSFDYPDSEVEASAPLCSDGVDNDYDGVTDCDDPSCDGHCPEMSALRCADGRDNDGDGLSDDLDPRCWDGAKRQVLRCASTEPTLFEERFDGDISAARWFSFGEVGGSPVVQSQLPIGREGRMDRVFGARSTAMAAMGGAVSKRVFEGDARTFTLSFSARLEAPGFLRVALVPAALAPEGAAPTDGSETASISLTLDARVDPSIALVASKNQVNAAKWDPSSWQQVKLSVSGEELVVHVAGQQVLSAPAVPIVPSRLVIWSESSFQQSGLGAAQIDDLRLVFAGVQPCGVASPQVPFGTTCRSDPAKIEQDVGFTVAVASSSKTDHCALLTSGQDRPSDVQSWLSSDGDAWELGATLPSEWSGALKGAGVAWDAEAERFRAVVGVEQPGYVALMVGQSPDCVNWDAFREVARLSSTVEAPSYMAPGIAAQHEIYVTYPANKESGRSLWRLRSDDGESFALEGQAVAVFDNEQFVAAPVSVSRYGPKDVVAVHPIASHASVRGLGLLVANSDDLSSWKTTSPWPMIELRNEGGGFDADALTAGALSFRGERALLLYSGRGQPLPSVAATGGSVLSAGTAWLNPPEHAVDAGNTTSDTQCGDGTCDASETCERCPIDCDPCEGELVFAETFSGLDAWELVEPVGEHVSKPAYRSSDTERLNLDPYQPGWLTHAIGNAAGDFELSFDMHVVAPSERATERCTAYVGVGEPPQSYEMDPRGVFLQVEQSLTCSGGAPAFSPRVRTGEARVTTSLSVDGAECSGTTLGVADAWHHVALRRESGVASIRVWGPDGCELTSDDAQVSYLGALSELDTILIGWASTFGDEGWRTCAGGTGAISVDNLLLRRLPCPDGSETCEDSGGRAICADLTKNPEHCGQCFHAVGPAEVCEGGLPVCQGTLCQDPDTGVETCADLAESDQHCGGCGIELTEHEVCRAGLRQPSMRLMPPGYFIDTTEVTRAQYAAWLATDPPIMDDADCARFKTTHRPSCGWPPGDRGNFPVRCVDWCDAYAYCQAVGKHLCGRIGGGQLQSNAERDDEAYDQWYHACSSNGLNQWNYGNEYDPEACNAGPIAEVASMPKCQSSEAAYSGVYDLAGSAAEWTLTCTEDYGCRVRLVAPDSPSDMDCSSTWRRAKWDTFSTTGIRCCAQ